MRETGIEIIGDVPWGTHFCQFYQTQEDLLDILVPYFKHGLKNNEYCMWITSAPLQKEQATMALRQDVPDLDARIAKGQIEILDYSQWYTLGGKFDADRVLQGWVERETQAIQKGYEGLRLTGNTFWLEKQDWNDFTDYEAKVNEIIGNHKMLALCTYSLERCSPIELIDVVKNHQFAIAKRNNTWEVLESAKNKGIAGALKTSERQYRGLVETIDAGFMHCKIVLDEQDNPIDYIYLDVNPGFEKVVGKRRAEVLNKRVTELFPAILKDPFGWISKFGHVALSGEPFQYEERSGVTKRYISGHVYSSERGYFEVLFFDVSDRKKAEQALQESEEKLRSIVESAPIGIHIWELAADGHLVFAGGNPTADTILCIDHRSLLGKTVVECFPAHAHTKVPEIYLNLARNGGTWNEDQFLYKDNTISGVFEVRAFQGAPGRTISMFSDVTERLKAQAEIRQKNVELTRINRDLEAFAFAASHDMQEPLRMVSSFVQLLADRYCGELDAEAEGYIQQVINGTNTMRNLVKALLDYSQIQNGPTRFATVDMNEIFKQALSGLSIAITESGAEISHDPLPQIQGDSMQLVEVLQNLIENGIKFRKENESPSIHVGVTPQDGNEWHFFVTDNGIGIDPKYIPKLFVIFKRLHARGKYTGTGVGLAMCKKIVERHEGRIWVESELGKGATFHFTLPKTKPN